MMEWMLEEAIGEAVDEIAATVRSTAGQERFAAIVERLLESENPVEQWLGTSMAMSLADKAEAQYEAELEGRVYSIYALGRVGESVCFYLGVSQDVPARYKKHLEDARCVSARAQRPVSARVYAEMEPKGRGIWCETWLSGLTETTAKQLEAIMVTGLVRGGVALENRNLRGEHAPPNRYPEGSPEYNEAQREYYRDRQANPDYRNRCLARKALWDLKQGQPLTPRKVEVITLAGRVEDALAILHEQGREAEWPGGEQV